MKIEFLMRVEGSEIVLLSDVPLQCIKANRDEKRALWRK